MQSGTLYEHNLLIGLQEAIYPFNRNVNTN